MTKSSELYLLVAEILK